MPDHAAAAASAPARQLFKVVINAPIHDVWREITRADAPIACFFNSRMDTRMLAPGSKLAMRTPDNKFTGVVGTILELVPPTRFSHTFKFTALDDPECKVTYELKEVAPNQTEFVLIIDDLPVGTKTARQMVQGGKLITSTLKSVLETGRPATGTRVLFLLFRALQPLTPRKCRSDNWPV